MLKQLASAFGKSKAPDVAWGRPYELDRGPIGKAVMAMDARGRGLAVWDNNGALWTTSLAPTGRVSLTHFPVAPGHNPCLAINGKGKGMLLWQTGQDHVFAASLSGSASFGHTQVLSTRGRVNHLQVAVDRRGGAIALWTQEIEGLWELRVQTFDARSQSWEPASTPLGRPSRFPLAPRLLMNAKGLAMAVWYVEEQDFAGPVVVYNWPTERIWSDHPIPIATCKARELAGAVDEEGNAYVCWVRQDHGEQTTLEVSRFSGSACAWETPRVLAAAPMLYQPEMTVNAGGDALLIWHQTENSRVTSILGRHFQGGGWDEEPHTLDTGIHGPSVSAMVLAPGQTTVLVLPPVGKPMLHQHQGLRWLNSVALDWPSQGSPHLPSLATSPQGALAIWLSRNQEGAHVMVSGAS